MGGGGVKGLWHYFKISLRGSYAFQNYGFKIRNDKPSKKVKYS